MMQMAKSPRRSLLTTIALVCILTITPLTLVDTYAGGTYEFSVTCASDSLVAVWNTGDIDPGKECSAPLKSSHLG